MRRIGAGTVTAVALVIASMTGCGSGGDELTLAQWTTQADAVCRDANLEIDELGTAVDAPSIRDLLRRRAAVRQLELDRLRALPVPGDHREQIEDLLGGFEVAQQQVRAAAGATTVEETVAGLRAAQDAVIQARAAAAGAGLVDCGLDPGELQATETLMDEGRVREILDASVNADGRLTPEEVRCIVDGILAAVPTETIAEVAERGATLPPEVVEVVRTATQDCLSADRLAELAG